MTDLPTPGLRRMGPPHLQAVEEIEKASFAAGWPATAFQRELTGNGAARYIVVQEAGVEVGGIAGFAGLWLMLDEAHVVGVAVLPERRREGLGRLLVHGLLRVAIEEGMTDATLECRVSNLAARALYRSFGFHEVGARKRYYADNGEDAVIMTTEALDSAGFKRTFERQEALLLDRWPAISLDIAAA